LKQEAKQLASDMKKLPEQMQAPQEMKDAMEAMNDLRWIRQWKMPDNRQSRTSISVLPIVIKMRQESKECSQQIKRPKKKLSQNEKQKTLAELKELRDEMNRLSKSEDRWKNNSQSAQPQSNCLP